MPKACGLVTSWIRCVPTSSCVWPLASVLTEWASQTFSKKGLGHGISYNMELIAREILVWLPAMPREYQYPFELRHLVYFREVARRLHFRKAAEALAIAQPALSRQIAQLEAALGRAPPQPLEPAGRADSGRRRLRGADRARPGFAHAGAGRHEGGGRGTGRAPAGRLHRPRDGDRPSRHPARVPPPVPGHPPRAQRIPDRRCRSRRSRRGEIDCGFFHPDGPSPGIETTLLLQRAERRPPSGRPSPARRRSRSS